MLPELSDRHVAVDVEADHLRHDLGADQGAEEPAPATLGEMDLAAFIAFVSAVQFYAFQ
jgi:hypothetical protein